MTLNPAAIATHPGQSERASFAQSGPVLSNGQTLRPPAVDAQALVALFGSPRLGGAEIHALEAIAQTRAVSPGEIVFGRDDTAQAVVALMAGSVALGLSDAEGVFRPERIVVGPAWLDLGSAWIGQKHGLDARAGSIAAVLALPCDALSALFDHHVALAPRLLRGLANEVHWLADNTHELMHKGATARFAQWLLKRCPATHGEAGQAGEKLIQLHERKRDIASQLAITPETLSRLMRCFIRDGVIAVNGYQVRVLDLSALEQLAQA
jgi:CRP-like cAMP-binding protein